MGGRLHRLEVTDVDLGATADFDVLTLLQQIGAIPPELLAFMLVSQAREARCRSSARKVGAGRRSARKRTTAYRGSAEGGPP